MVIIGPIGMFMEPDNEMCTVKKRVYYTGSFPKTRLKMMKIGNSTSAALETEYPWNRKHVLRIIIISLLGMRFSTLSRSYFHTLLSSPLPRTAS